MLGVFVIAASATGIHPPTASADSNLIFLSDCDFGFHSPNYQSNEAVCVSGRVAFDDGEFLIPSGDVFVTSNLDWVDKAILEIPDPDNPGGPPLLTTDVTRGGANLVVGPGIGGAFFDEFVWLPMLEPGEYDIVLDDNRNGIYDAGIDYVVGGGAGFAFRVNPAPLGAFVIDVNKIKGGAAVEKENWEGVSKVYDNIGLMKDALNITKDLIIASGGPGTVAAEFVKGKVKGKIPVLKDIKKVEYNDAVMDIGKQMLAEVSKVMITHYDDLVNDPADPDFEHMVALDVVTIDSIIDAALADLGFANEYPYQPLGQRPLEAAFYDTANRLLEQAALVRALIQSHEKFLGARDADDLDWALIHANGMIRYSALLEANLHATNASAVEQKAAMLALPGGLNEFEVEFLKAIKDQMENGGFTKEEILELHNGGWTDADIANLTSAILDFPLPDANFTGPGTMDELIATNNDFLVFVEEFGADALVLRDNLEFFVFEVDEPLADAGRPYTAGTGATVSLDGTASISNDTSLIFEWDTDLDGDFDDLAGNIAPTSFITPGDRLVGLRVTNDLGLSDIDYALVQVSLSNQSPVITSFTPSELDVRVDVGDTTEFTVAATDPETETLSFEWFRNGVSVGTGTSYSYLAASGDEGIQVVRVQVSDTNPSSPHTFEQRELAVRSGDGDGDLYHSNFDCNDADPDVNPGAAEVVGDGIDNDCDAATPDSGEAPVVSFMSFPVIPVFGVETEFFSTATDANDDIVGFEWNFGDGFSSTEENPTHTFNTGGDITVSLTVTDAQANETTTTRIYSIKTPPVPAFSVNPDPAELNEPVQFNDLSTDTDGTIIDWKWDFDADGVTDSELQNPEFTFVSTGLFPVRLIVTDNDGVSVSSTTDVLVARRPVPDFTVAPSNPVVAVDAQFTDFSTDDGTILEWNWDFDNDGVVDSTLQNPVHQFLTSGLHFVRLSVVDDVGAVGNLVRGVTVEVGDPPIPFFSFLPSPPVVGIPVDFTDESTDPDNAIVGWEWDFDTDGVVDSTLQHPTHVFPTFGSTNIQLRVTDQAGNQGELILAGIPVRAPPVASFDVSNSTPAVGETVTFTDTSTDPDSGIANYEWDFGDGTTGVGLTPTHTYATGGTFTVTLTVTDVHTLVSTASQEVAVTAAGGGPSADFDFSPATPLVGETITFIDTSTGAVATYEWDFEDDGTPDSTLQNPTFSFPTPGTFTVRLTVTDAGLNSDSTTRQVTVGEGFSPVADFRIEPVQPVTDERTFFFNESTDADDAIVSFSWDFGDGGTSTLQNPNHIYETPGTYDVTLTVVDEAGNPDSVTVVGIVLLDRPNAQFSFAPVGTSPIRVGDDVQFTDESIDSDSTTLFFEWDFDGDGTPDSTVQNPIFSFPSNGTFDVVLTVTDTTGLADSFTLPVVVVAGLPPTPLFSFDPTTLIAGETVQFTDESTDPDDAIVHWEWDFNGDGLIDSFLQHPTHVYPTFGTNDVRLLVRDEGGNQVALTITGIPVIARPVASFTINDATPDVAQVVSFNSTSTDPDGTISFFDWDFGDGSFGTGASTTHAYATGGTFNVTLTVTDSQTLESSTTQQVIVTDIGGPTADFSFLPTEPIVGTGVDFIDESTDDGSVDTWEWDFETDGVIDSTLQHPTHVFSTSDTFTVTVTVTDNESNSDSIVRNVVVGLGSPPVAAFTNGAVSLDEPTEFTDLSTDPDADIVSWDWDFGDTGTSTDQHPTHIYTTLGLKTVTLTVTDIAGNSHFVSQDVVVLDGVLPTADFSFTPPDPIPGQDIQFTDLSTDNGAIVLWEWDFEDDGIVDSTEQHPTHAFPTGGDFNVSLRVEDVAGNSDTVVRLISISTAPLAAFTTSKARNVARLQEGAEIAEFSSVHPAAPPINAIDNSSGSAWETREGSVPGEFIEIELVGLSLHTVDEIFVEGGSGTDAIRDFEVHLSPDGTEGSFTLAATGTSPQSHSGLTVSFTATDARFARLVAIDNYGAGHVRVEQFKVFDTGDVNVASSAAGATIRDFSSVFTNNPEWRVIDGSTGFFWSPQLGTVAGEFLIVKLTDQDVDLHVINEVRIEGNSGTEAIRGFELLVSTTGTDPGDFTSILIGEAAKSTELTEITFPPVQARFVKLVVLSNWGHATQVRLDRLELWTQDREGGIVSLWEGPPGKVIDVSSVSGTSFAENAIDQPFSSAWRATGSTDEFITIALAGGHIYLIDEIRFYSSDSGAGPKNFDLLVSTTDSEDASFSLAYSGVGIGGNSQQSHTFPPVEARFIKLVIHDLIDPAKCCAQLNNLAIDTVPGGVPTKSRGLGAAVVEFSSAANTNTEPAASTDLSTSGGWTTANGMVTDQFFKLSLVPGTPGPPHLVNKFHIEGSSGTNSVREFEIWLSDTGFTPGSGLADPKFKLAYSGTMDQVNGLRWFEIEPTRATHMMFVARNNHGHPTQIFLDRFRAYALNLGGPVVPFEDRSVDPGGTIVAWDWDFGDGATSTEQHPVHIYNETGTFSVTLTVTDDEGKSDSTSFDYTVLQGPVAAFTQETLTPVEGEVDRLTDVSTDDNGPIIFGLWSFDYKTNTSTSSTFNNTFPDNGEFKVTRFVRDNQLLTDSVTKTFIVSNKPPQNVRARMDNNEVAVSGVVGTALRSGGNWNDVADDGPGVVCDLDYGDGTVIQVEDCTSSGLSQIFHTYTAPGEYTHTLTVTDKDGDWASDTLPVSIRQRESHTTIWGEDALRTPDAGGPVTAHARLIDFEFDKRGTPLVGEIITFSLGGVTQDVVTDVNGEASALFVYAEGQDEPIIASFAGNAEFEGSLDRPFVIGDVIASVGDGMSHRFDRDGNFINVFDTQRRSRETTGMCFDSDDNLYITSFQLGILSKFDRTTGVTTPVWASGFSTHVESCVLARENIDADPELEDVIFTGEVDGASNIRKFDRAGNLLDVFDVEVRDRGADWMDLTIDPVTGDFIMFYTTEGDDVLRYDVTNDVQLPDFVPDQSIEANQLVPRPQSLPENAIDDDVNTHWRSTDGENSNLFITVDLVGGTQSIDTVFIEGSTSSEAIKNFEVQVSTTGIADTDFTTVLTGVSPRDNTGVTETFTPVDAVFVRLLAIDNHNNSKFLRVDQFRVLNTADENVASQAEGATIVDFNSVEKDAMLFRPCFALRVLLDGSVMTACRHGVAHIAADGTELINYFPRETLESAGETLFALNLDSDGTSFWTGGIGAGPIVKADIATGTVLLSVDPMRRGPNLLGLLVYGELLAAIDQVPVADPQSVSTDEDIPLPVTLTGTDFDGDPLSFTIVTPPVHGDLTGLAPDLTYTPDPDYVGPDSFTFRVNDGTQDSVVALIDIDVLLVNSPPVADTGGPYVAIAGETIHLDGSDSFDVDADDTITSFEWDLDNDGEFDDSVLPGPPISFNTTGLFTVSLRVTDNHGTIGTESTSVLVNGDPPEVEAGADQTVGKDDLVSLDPATFVDSGPTDTHTATIDWGDGTLEAGTLTQSAGSGSVDGSHTYGTGGDYVVLVCVTDSDGLTGCDSLLVTVENALPAADAGGPYAVDEGGSVVLDGTGSSDSDGTIITFEWDLDGDTIFGETGVDAVAGDETGATPTFNAFFADGPVLIPVSLRVTDDGGGVDTATVDVAVTNVAPTVVATGETIDEGDSASITVNFTDPFLFETFSASIDWDDGLGFVPIGIVGPPGTPFMLSHDYPEDGTFTVTVTVTDDDGGVGQATATVIVNNVAPVVLTSGDTTAEEGNTATVTSSFTDPGVLDTHTSIIDWGDGSPAEPITSTHVYPENGLYIVTVTVTDDDGGVGQATAQVTVNNVAPAVSTSGDTTINEGDTAIVTSSFTDPGVLDTHTSVIDWGDGTGPEPLTSTHVYPENGLYTVTVTVTDDDGGVGSATATVFVNNVAPTVSTSSDTTINEGDTATVTSSFTDPGVLDTHTSEIDWGDGTGPEPLTSTHVYPENGIFTVTVTVTDDDGGVGSATATVFVNNVAPAVSTSGDTTINEGDTATVTSSFTDPGVLDTHTSIIDWGDGSPAEPITSTHVYPENGLYTVTVTVTDDDGGVGQATAQVTVNNVAPTPDAGGPYEVNEGSSVGLTGTATDPAGANDTLTFIWDLDEDGIFGESGADAANGAENGEITTFSALNIDGPATITVALRVSDDDGGVATDTAIVEVRDLISPIADAGGPYSVDEGSTVPVIGTGSDPDGDIVLYEWDLDGDGTFDFSSPTSGSTTFDATALTGPATFTITLRVTDDDGLTGLDSTTVDIIHDSVQPVAITTGPYFIDEGSNGLLDGTGSVDPDGTIVSYEWDIDGDGTFDLTGPTPLFDATSIDGPAVFSVTLRVTDDEGLTDTAATTVTVNNVAPVVTVAPVSGETESPVNLDVTFTDPAPADTHSATIDWGDGTVEPLTSVTSPFSAQHTYLDEGSFTVTVTVTDDDGGSGDDSNSAVIALHPNSPPVAEPGGPYEVDEGSTVDVNASASFDPDAPGSTPLSAGIGAFATLSHGEEIVLYEWDFDEDGIFGETGAAASNGDETGITATFDASLLDGPRVIVIGLRVTDSAGDIGLASTTVNVLNVSPSVETTGDSIDEGSVAEITVSFTDPGVPDTHSATINWGDGSPVEVLDSISSPFFPTHTYEDNGTYDVEVTVTDDDGGEGESSTTVLVANVAPTGSLSNNGPVDEGSSASVSFTGQTDPSQVDLDAGLIYSFDFGNDGSFEVTGSDIPTEILPLDLTADGPASIPVLGRIEDKDGGFTDVLTTVIVNNVQPVAEMIGDLINEGEQAEITALIFEPGVLDTITMTIDWGDGTVDVLAIPAATDQISPTHTYPDDDPTDTLSDVYTVEITLEDKDGAIFHTFTTVTVVNLAPTVIATSDIVLLGNPSTVSISFADAGVLDTHTGTIDWGDGTVEPLGSLTSPTDATHIYATDGTFDVTVTVTDDDTGVGTAEIEVLVDLLVPETPVANAGGPYAVDEASSVALDGSASSDPDGDLVLYEWDMDEDGIFGETGAAAENGDEVGVAPTFSAAELDGPEIVTVSLRVTDNDGLTSDTNSTQVAVSNVAPTGVLSVDAPVVEGTGQAIVRITDGSDPSPADAAALRYSFDFGNNGEFDVVDSPTPFHAVPLSFTLDGPALVPVRGIISDDDGGSSEYLTNIEVLNGAPAAELTDDVINEGETATITALLSDPGVLDGGVMTIDWGDGTVDDIPFPAGTASLVLTHLYLDDDPTATSEDVYTVSVTIVDKDGGTSESATTVRVKNIAPTVTATTAGVVVGETATLSGTLTDPGILDTHSIAVDWGDGSSNTFLVPAGTTTYVRTHDYATAGTFTIVVTVIDDDTGIGTTSLLIQVTDDPKPPVSDAGGPYTVVEGEVVELSGAASSDPDGTIVLYEWDLDEDGVFGETGPGATNGDEIGVSPTFTAGAISGPATVTVALTVTDDHGQSDTDTATVTVGVVLESLGPVDIADGSRIIAAGTGLLSQPGIIEIFIPDGATVEQVLLYWESFERNGRPHDHSVTVNGIEVTGTSIGGPTEFFSSTTSQTFRADITHLGVLSPGPNSVVINGASSTTNNGAGIVAIIDDGTVGHLDLRDGNDLAFRDFSPPLDTTTPQVFDFEAESHDRVATISMFFSSVTGTASGSGSVRPSSIEITVDGITTTLTNELGSLDRDEWDTLIVDVNVPAGATSITVQAFSRDDDLLGNEPASFVWSMVGLTLADEGTQPPPPSSGDGLGESTVALADGSQMIAAGTGLISQPGTIELSVPDGATVEQVLLYWEGFQREARTHDDSVTVNGIEVIGTSLGEPTVFFGNTTSQTFRADITSLGAIVPGNNSVVIAGNSGNVPNGAGIVVIIDDGTAAHLDLRDGNDLAFHDFAPPLDTTTPQIFRFDAATHERTATLSMFFSSVSGSASGSTEERATSIEITVGGVTTTLTNLLGSLDENEWDTLITEIVIPAGVDSVSVQAFSRDDTGTGINPASFVWTMVGLSLPDPAVPQVLVTTTSGGTGEVRFVGTSLVPELSTSATAEFTSGDPDTIDEVLITTVNESVIGVLIGPGTTSPLTSRSDQDDGASCAQPEAVLSAQRYPVSTHRS